MEAAANLRGSPYGRLARRTAHQHDAAMVEALRLPPAVDGVTWLHSYVTGDRKKSFCVYDAPTPEAIRKSAKRNDLPIDQITQVSVLDPYFFW